MSNTGENQIPFFGMEHARDLLEKLEWEFQRLSDEPNNKFSAFNFFVTAEHLLDWVHPGQRSNARDARRASEPLLQVISHLCNRAKHLRLRAAHKSVMRAEVGLGPPRTRYMGHNIQTWGGYHVVLWVYVAAHLQPTFQDRITPIDLAQRTLAYWRAQPEVQ